MLDAWEQVLSGVMRRKEGERATIQNVIVQVDGGITLRSQSLNSDNKRLQLVGMILFSCS